MEATSIQALLGQFVRQVESDCHETATAVQRSDAFKALRARACEAFPQVVVFYDNFSPTVGDCVQEGIQMSLAFLLVYLAKELHLSDPPSVPHTRVSDWVRWGREAYAACTC